MKIRVHPSAVGFVAFSAIQLVCRSMKWEVVDEAGMRDSAPDHPVIWAFWHNRVFSVPFVYREWLPERHGKVLTSPSYDGDIIASTLRCFEAGAVRGSTNKRPMESFRECLGVLKRGDDLCVTPDGPRGPRCRVQPGLIRLAQLSGCPIFPLRIDYERYREFDTWDGFRIPRLFSRATATFGPLTTIPRDADPEEAEAQVAALLGE